MHLNVEIVIISAKTLQTHQSVVSALHMKTSANEALSTKGCTPLSSKGNVINNEVENIQYLH